MSNCACCHEHTEEAEVVSLKKNIVIFSVSIALWVVGFLLPEGNHFLYFAKLAAFIAAYFLAGASVLKNAALTLIKTRSLDENFLMAAATIGAFAIGEWAEAVAVMILYMAGELLQEAAVQKSQKSIKGALDLRPATARLQTESGFEDVPTEDVETGSVIMVKAGEKIPLDGIVIEGAGSVNMAMLTGESLPVPLEKGSDVFSGAVSIDGMFLIKTTKSAADSSAQKIAELVERAREGRAKPERFMTAFARKYTPCVVLGALLLAVLPPLLGGGEFSVWLYKALTLLVISCPCALVLSIPLAYFAGIGGLSKRGILLKSAEILDALCKVKIAAFDKTGTLTKGEFTVTSIECENGVTQNDLLIAAKKAAFSSTHPLSRAIYAYAASETGGENIEPCPSVKEIAGQGLSCTTKEGSFLLLGNEKLLCENGVTISGAKDNNTASAVLFLAKDGVFYGRIFASDTIKEGAKEAVARLVKLGVREIELLSGDRTAAVEDAAGKLGIKNFSGELLPEDKLRRVKELGARGKTMFIGDGINDAPVLQGSDVGVAMGAKEGIASIASGVIIMTSDPLCVPEVVERAQNVRKIVIQNVIFTLGIKSLFFTLAILGFTSMWFALIADVGTAVLAVLNAGRSFRK